MTLCFFRSLGLDLYSGLAFPSASSSLRNFWQLGVPLCLPGASLPASIHFSSRLRCRRCRPPGRQAGRHRKVCQVCIRHGRPHIFASRPCVYPGIHLQRGPSALFPSCRIAVNSRRVVRYEADKKRGSSFSHFCLVTSPPAWMCYSAGDPCLGSLCTLRIILLPVRFHSRLRHLRETWRFRNICMCKSVLENEA